MVVGEVSPPGLTGMTGGQPEANAVAPFPHPAADLDQPQAHVFQRHPGDPGGTGPATDGVEQPVGGGVQQQPKLVGPETVATEAIGETAMLEVLDPVFALAAIDVPVVHLRGRVGAGGDDEAGIGFLRQDFDPI